MTGKRLPDAMRKSIESPSTWGAERERFGRSILDWLRADTSPESISDIKTRLDAVMEFTIFVAREFLIRNYSLEKHESDVYAISSNCTI